MGVLQAAKFRALATINTRALGAEGKLIKPAGDQVLLACKARHPERMDHVQGLHAQHNLSIFANMRAESPEALAAKVFSQKTIGGLNGPTVSRIIHRDGDPNWYDLHIIIHRDELFSAINELRAIGGSGVVVTPVTYIFEEEPPRYKAMIQQLMSNEK